MSKFSSKDCGSFTISPSGVFKACTYTTITMTYTVGKTGLPIGSALKIGLPNMGWSEPLTPYARGDSEVYKDDTRLIARYYPCNTTATVENNSNASVYLTHRCSQNIIGPYNNWSWWITATVELADLVEGDKIIVIYGDTSRHEKAALVQPWIEKDRLWFTGFVNPDCGTEFIELAGSPVTCAVEAGPLDKCLVTAPSVINSESESTIRLSLTDWGNDPVDKADVKDVEITDANGNEIANDKVFSTGPLDKLHTTVSSSQMPCTVKVETADGKIITGKSNPSVSRQDTKKLFWGDLHCHSFYHQYNEKLGYGDPCTSPDELFKYAKDVTHLDFVAITDGRGALPDNAGWKVAQQAAIDNYHPGEFVSLKGWEIQFGEDGHRNAIYRDAIIESQVSDPAFSKASVWESAGDMGGMLTAFKEYKGRDDVMLIPHHPMVWMNWERHDPNLDRLVEIYSCWGSSEYERNDLWTKASLPELSVQYALSKGYKLGFVGGSDSHTGYVGRSISNADRYRFCCYKAGFTGVYAEDLTREAIFNALRNRQCYATTGIRMIIDFSVDGIAMGSINQTDKKSKHTLKFNLAGTDMISKVDIVRDNETIYTIEPFKDTIADEWTDDSPEAADASYYYLRVTQVDKNRGWSSPVWV